MDNIKDKIAYVIFNVNGDIIGVTLEKEKIDKILEEYEPGYSKRNFEKFRQYKLL